MCGRNDHEGLRTRAQEASPLINNRYYQTAFEQALLSTAAILSKRNEF